MSHHYNYSPSAPPPPDPDEPRVAHPYHPPITNTYADNKPPLGSNTFFPQTRPVFSPYQQQQQPYGHFQLPSFGSGGFPGGTHPDVINSFQMVDRNRNGFIEEIELQEALLWKYHKFCLRTLRLLIFLFKNHRETYSRIGPKEFTDIWTCLGQWREIFERFDRDRSGKIDAMELRDALYSLGYALSPSVLHVLISKYDDGRDRKLELDFDSFVECGMIVKVTGIIPCELCLVSLQNHYRGGLTEKFKEKDQQYSGSATLTYDTFMSMIIPFIVAE